MMTPERLEAIKKRGRTWDDHFTNAMVDELVAEVERLGKRVEERGVQFAEAVFGKDREYEPLYREAVGALEDLCDVQNGPPLVTYAEAWDEAMGKALAVIEKAKSKGKT